jgi:hypothetical protein
MKRIFALLVALLLCCFLSVAIAAEESGGAELVEQGEEQAGKDAWQVYVEEKLAPTVAAVVSAVGSAYILLLPILRRLIRSGKAFDVASGGVARVSDNTRAYQKELLAIKDDVVALTDTVCADKEETRRILEEILQVVLLAFSHEEELVKNGTARRIMKVVEENGKEQS